MFYLLRGVYNREAPEDSFALFLLSTPEHPVVTSHSFHLTSLSETMILCGSNPGEGRTRRPYWLAQKSCIVALSGGSRPRLQLEPGYQVRLRLRPILSEGYSCMVQSLKLMNPVPSPPVSFAAVALAGPQSSRVLGSRASGWLHHADCVERTLVSGCHSFSLVQY